MKPFYPGISRESALKELNSFITELDAGWERDGLDWAPALLTLLRAISAEASKEAPDSQRLEDFRTEVHQYFAKHKFLKGICFALELVDAICGHTNT
jgi:hypothetical protein